MVKVGEKYLEVFQVNKALKLHFYWTITSVLDGDKCLAHSKKWNEDVYEIKQIKKMLSHKKQD